MRPAAPEVCGASFAFRDSVAEAAFVAFIGRSSRNTAIVVRIALLVAWGVRLVTWALAPHGTANLGGSLIIVAAIAACLAAVFTCIAQLATDQRFVLHEWIKSRSHIWYLILVMVKLIGLSRLGKLQRAAAVMTFLFSVVVCFDRVRLPVTLRLFGLSLVSYTLTQAVQWLDHPAQRDAGAEWRCLRSLLAGQAALLLLTAVRELCGRTTFLQLHPSERRQPLPRFWKALSAWVPAPLRQVA